MKGNSITHSNHSNHDNNNHQNIRKNKIKIEDDNNDNNDNNNDDNDNNTKRSITTSDGSMNNLFMLLKNNYNSEGNNLFRGPLRQALLASNHIYAAIIEEDEYNIFANDIATKYNNINSNNDPLITACMTNPPFYNTDEDIIGYDNTICTASNVEKFTEGGELAFLTAIIADSLVLRNRYIYHSHNHFHMFNILSQIGFVGLPVWQGKKVLLILCVNF